MQGARGTLTDVEIRIFLRDHPETNKLLMDFEFTPEEIRTAQTLAVDRWNDTPPFLNNFSTNDFPFRWAWLVGTTANLLTMAAHKFRRDNLTYTVPGGSIDDQNKAPIYDQAAAVLSAQYQDWMIKTKVHINISQCWGSDTLYYGYDKFWLWFAVAPVIQIIIACTA